MDLCSKGLSCELPIRVSTIGAAGGLDRGFATTEDIYRLPATLTLNNGPLALRFDILQRIAEEMSSLDDDLRELTQKWSKQYFKRRADDFKTGFEVHFAPQQRATIGALQIEASKNDIDSYVHLPNKNSKTASGKIAHVQFATKGRELMPFFVVYAKDLFALTAVTVLPIDEAQQRGFKLSPAEADLNFGYLLQVVQSRTEPTTDADALVALMLHAHSYQESTCH